MAQLNKQRRKPIKEFAIPSVHTDIMEDTWKRYEKHAIWYGVPQEKQYEDAVGKNYKCFRIPAFDQQRNLKGYVPLAHRYVPAWINLSKTVVFYLCEWRLWVAESKKGNSTVPQDVILELKRDTGTKLWQYLAIRRMVVQELLGAILDKAGGQELNVFDEYIMRETRCWLWSSLDEIPQEELWLLGLDPTANSNREFFFFDNLPHKMLHCDDGWIWGSVAGYEQGWYGDIKALIKLVRNKKRRNAIADRPWREKGAEPKIWNERQRPVIVFLNEEGDKSFNLASSSKKRGRADTKGSSVGQAGEDRRKWAVRRRVTSPEAESGLNSGKNEGSGDIGRGDVDSVKGSGERATQEVPGVEMAEDSAGGGTQELLAQSVASQAIPTRLDNPTTRNIIHDYVHGGDTIVQTAERLESALGKFYSPQLWSQVMDAVRKGDEEEDRLEEVAISEAFKNIIGEEQRRLDLVEQQRYLSQEL